MARLVLRCERLRYADRVVKHREQTVSRYLSNLVIRHLLIPASPPLILVNLRLFIPVFVTRTLLLLLEILHRDRYLWVNALTTPPGHP